MLFDLVLATLFTSCLVFAFLILSYFVLIFQLSCYVLVLCCLLLVLSSRGDVLSLLVVCCLDSFVSFLCIVFSGCPLVCTSLVLSCLGGL